MSGMRLTRAAVVVGSPKAGSGTLRVALAAASALGTTGKSFPDQVVIDLTEIAPEVGRDRPPPNEAHWLEGRGTIETVRGWRILAYVSLIFVAVACTTSAKSSGSGGTTSPPQHAIDSRYPPVPVGSPRGCVGRGPTGTTAAQAASITSRVDVLARGQLQMTVTCPGGPVLIGLDAGEEQLAHRLLAQFGRNLAVTVGLTNYDGSPGRSPRCGRLAPSAPLPTGLHLSLRLAQRSVRSAASFSASVVVSERGPTSFTIITGKPLEAVLVRLGTLQVVGIYDGAIAGTGYGLHLGAGQSSTMPAIGGTARCDGGLGSALPPGTYWVIVRLAPEGRSPSPSYLTPAVPLRVTPS